RGGVVYEVDVPLTVFRRLPAVGTELELRTLQVVREDSAALYGFVDAGERELFRRLLGASGVGAKLALAMLSTYDAPRLARALVEKDVPALRQVSGVGKKTAERLVLDLADKVTDLAVQGGGGAAAGAPPGAQDAVAALVALGYAFADADAAVRAVLSDGEVTSTDELIRKALQAG
ncbi:MAG: Holliday junction branch migration protein RuvA, partial [Longimicrobiales bacterium]